MRKLLTKFVLLLVSFTVYAQVEPIDTDGNGYRNISTLEHLRWVSENSSCCSDSLELDNDINAGDTRKWNDGKGWSPIGNKDKDFTGKLNGNGHYIDSLYINRPNEYYVSFIGKKSYYLSEVTKIGLENCSIIGNGYVSGLIASNIGNVTRCYTTGNVKGNEYMGGLIAYNSGKVTNCY